MMRWQCVPRVRACAGISTRWRLPAPQCLLWNQARRCHSADDEDKYLELKQLRDIKRSLCGRLFLENTRPKNIATSLKSAKFLKFFFSQIRPNVPPATSHDGDDTDLFLEYPYRSPCGKEMNFIKCADLPFVFEDLYQDEKTKQWVFVYGGGALKAPFDPTKLKISLTTGRLYHDLSTKFDSDTRPSVALVKSQLAVELGKHIIVHNVEDADGRESAGDAEMIIGEIEWQEQRFPIKAIE
ncbi:putative mitochondrial protein, partial [Globisporangium splendens]